MSNPQKMLRNKLDGTVYYWNPILAANPRCEEITYEEAFPEKHIPKRSENPPKIDMSVDESTLSQADEVAAEEATPATPAELAREAARGLADDLG